MSSYHHLTQRQRYIIQDMRDIGKSQSEIARELQVDRSTILREFKRNSNSKGGYKAKGAQAYVNGRREHLSTFVRKIDGPLEEAITSKLRLGWSPQLISARLKLETQWHVSHETIYKWIYGLAPAYKVCLRRRGKRQKRGGKYRKRTFGPEPRKSIEQRELAADQRLEFGHWERDLIIGNISGHALLVIVDRKSRRTLIRRVESKACEEVNAATTSMLRGEICHSITNDNGIEFGQPKDLENSLDIAVYFAHPYSSWERGTVENTNGLIRQFYPKKTNFNDISDESIASMQNNLNGRPRKMFGYRSPDEITSTRDQKMFRSERTYRSEMNRRFKREFIADMKRECCT